MRATGTKRSLQSFSRDALRRWRHDHSSQPNPFHTLHFSSWTSTTKFSPALKSLKKKLAVGALPTIHRTATAFKSYAETCASLLRQCADHHPLALGPTLHAHAIKSGVSADRSISTKLLTMYSNWGWLAYRDRVFGEADGFDLFSWNYMITAYARCGDLDAARHLFDRMPERNVVTWTVMVDGHMKCGKVQESIEYFERNPFRTVISWTAMICGFVQNGLYFEALVIFHRMLESSLMPNEVTFTSVVRACIGAGEFDLGKSIVGLIIKTNFERNLSVCNSLIALYLRMGEVDLARIVFDEMEERDVVSWTVLLDVYAEIGDLVEARRIFDEMPERNEVSWSTMIARYSQNGEALEALRMFYHMLHDGYRPNVSCFSSALSASSNLENLLFGSNVHCYAIKAGFDSDVYVGSSLIDMYFRCGKLIYGHQVFDLLPEKNIVCWNSMIAGFCYNGKMEEADELFKNMPVKNVVSWNAIISGYAQNERYSKVLETFDDMLMSGQTPSQMTFSSVLHACANLSSLEKGKNLHAKILKLGIQDEVFMGTALIDMYAKSGDIESSKKVFCRMPEKNEISWTAMVQGLADNGFAEESIILFEEMKKTAIVPTEPIFLSILFACSHCGLVDKGFHYFESMKNVYDIMPKEKHYTCMVDLLARAGHLRDAEELISTMPVQPEANSWAALLSACSMYGDEEIGERAAKKLWESEKNNSAGYVLLANLYASCRRWKDAAKIHRLQMEYSSITWEQEFSLSID
ncbi:pentatricopeptide repeat-containing protein [Cocos nucifera]|uniref:Pentatricopeptide repeat-containing protein n=1 Tax=Cocos nucifera TaxID=13894 RepID=A0A8K0IUW7_COCNU|nr:pentatricopeptide repeat-containing protein [Cocos nucifera]